MRNSHIFFIVLVALGFLTYSVGCQNSSNSNRMTENESPMKIISPDGTTTLLITPEEARRAIREWHENPENSGFSESLKKICENCKNDPTFDADLFKGKWESVTDIDSQKQKWEYSIIIEGWLCDLVEGTVQVTLYRAIYLGLFKKNENGGWELEVFPPSRFH